MMVKKRKKITKGARVITHTSVGPIVTTKGLNLGNVGAIVDEYKYQLTITGGNASDLLAQIIDLGQTYLLKEKAYKVSLGYILSVIKETTDSKTYGRVCQDEFNMQRGTANRYALVYEALFSGNFLYQLPKNPDTEEMYNIFELSMRDMEAVAKLIIAGEFDEDAAHILFGSGNWLDKRELIKEEKDGVIRTNRKSAIKAREKTLSVREEGDLYYINPNTGEQIRFGFLDINSNSAVVSAYAERAADALKDEFMREVLDDE